MDYRLTYDMPAPVSGPSDYKCVCGHSLDCISGLGVLGVGQMFRCPVCQWTNLSPHPPLSHCQKCGQLNAHGHECASA